MKTIGVVGAGTMGGGIARLAAQAGFDVLLTDASGQILIERIRAIADGIRRSAVKENTGSAEPVIARLRPADIDGLAGCDVVVEAAAESLDVKRAIFAGLAAACGPGAILATNTSSLSITSIAKDIPSPGRVAGMHFFNPAHVMKLVEVVRGKDTSDETVARLVELSRTLKKTPVVVRDSPGFIVNRVARPFYLEALRLLGEGAGSVERIDAIVKESGGFRMGPFELMDLIGLDVNLAVTKSVWEQFSRESRFNPHEIQEQMVAAGRLGKKSGRGFYDYGGRLPA